MDRKKRAVNLFNSGYYCSQAVLVVFSNQLGLEEETALRISTGFGAGMGGAQSTCGVVTGAYMVLGLLSGNEAGEERAQRENFRLLKLFNRLFLERNGDLKCLDLTGIDFSTAEGLKRAREMQVFENKCTRFIGDGVEILEGIIQKQEG